MHDHRPSALTDLTDLASDVLEALKARKMMIATAESCTGGLIAGVLTEIPGSSAAVDRGFVTYSNDAKMDMLGVSEADLSAHGAVSKTVAIAMAQGALAHSKADIAVAVTGIAGPDGGSEEKPVGTVHIAVAVKSGASSHFHCWFADRGRTAIRLDTVQTALNSVLNALDQTNGH